MIVTVSIDQPINFNINLEERTIESITLPTWCWQFSADAPMEIFSEKAFYTAGPEAREGLVEVLENADWPDEVTYE